MKKLLQYILSILGFAGCDIIGVGTEAYGTPYAEFNVNGIVTNGTTPLKQVQISLGSKKEGFSYAIDTTDSKGEFSFKTEVFPEDQQYFIVASDLTNTYQNDTVDVEIAKSDFNGKKKGDDWYAGSATKTVNFTLQKKDDK